MVSLPILALVFSVIAVALAAGAIIIVVDVRARAQSHESKRNGLEGQTSEDSPRSFAGNRAGTAGPFVSSNEPVSGRFQQVPETPPTAIAPKLKCPPRVSFGSQTNAPQLPPDDQAGRGEKDGGDSSTSSGPGQKIKEAK